MIDPTNYIYQILNVETSCRKNPPRIIGESQHYSASDTESQQHGFIGKSESTTVDEHSYTPSQEEETCDVEQVVATGRKSWKTQRRKEEAVWPPFL